MLVIKVTKSLATLAIVLLLSPPWAAVVDGQQHRGAPPGVNPQHYQGQPPPSAQNQQFQHQQQQFQQPPAQQFQQQPPPQQFQQQPPPQQFQQQPPPQQFQQQPPPQQFQQQPPPQQFQGQPVQHQAPTQQHGGKPAQQQARRQKQQVLHKEMSQEKEHVKDHMEIPIDTSHMTDGELQFHYFKMHDSDGNGKLDGCELVKSLIHWHDNEAHDEDKGGHSVPETRIFTDEELIEMIDPILTTDDKNQDGCIDYTEFVIAQQAAQGKAAAAV